MEELGILLVVIVIFVGALLGCAVIAEIVSDPLLVRISEKGYDSKDVRCFCRSVDISLETFLESQSWRNQYETFRDGGTSKTIETAMANKKARQARSNGVAVGMAMGMSCK